MRRGQEQKRSERKYLLDQTFNMHKEKTRDSAYGWGIDNGSVQGTMTISSYSASELLETAKTFKEKVIEQLSLAHDTMVDRDDQNQSECYGSRETE